MRIARYRHGDEVATGVVEGERVFPFAEGRTALDLARLGLAETLRLGAEATASGDGVPLADVTLLTPIDPPAVRDFVAFEEHVEGVVRSVSGDAGVAPEWYQAPTFYFTNPHTLRATGEPVPIPGDSAGLDFELEVGVVIGAVEGSAGSELSPEQAERHIFGYTVFNDWSARDLQRREMRVNLGPCKGKDFATTLGPWIVTADEFAERVDADGFLPLRMTVQVNGEAFGEDLLSHMGWPFRELVAYAARGSRIVPGDVLGSGTAGSGCLAEIWGRRGEQRPAPLQPGDTVTMEVEGIGRVENTLVAGTVLPPVAPARTRPRLERSR